MKTIYFVLVFIIISTCLYSTIINIPADQPTIQAGIDISVDADTVLVQPGTYVENINYNGKLITVASLFLTTQDTTYISQTVIDGNQDDSVVLFESGEDSTAVLTGFTITNGNSGWGSGGGIHCSNNSSPSLTNVIISENTIDYSIGNAIGGGISCEDNSSPSLVNVTIVGNTCGGYGGGIYCRNSSPSLENVTITGNSATRGGGIYCSSSSPNLVNVTIVGNTCGGYGGGIYCSNSSPSLVNVNIVGNSAFGGGGIYCGNSSLSFDSVNRCNIFLNYAGRGNDLYVSDCPTINVIVDTFSVLQPYDYFAYPVDNFTFDIQNAKIEQVNHDLYVNPSGSNDNSGLSPAEPLQTICYALAKITSDSTNPYEIYLANGTYSPSQTGEHFPLNCKSYVSIIGEEESLTILDGNDLRSILYCRNDNNFSVTHLTITNGRGRYGTGGGISCYESSPSLVNVNITGNSSYGWGIGGGSGGGIYCYDESNPSLENVTITGNSATRGGGIYCIYNSNPSLVNVTISDNSASDGGGIYCWNSSSSLINCILWNNLPGEIYGLLTATYSDIQGGWAGEGNIDEDPLFVGTGDHPFMLQDLSPCVNAGIPDTTGLNLPEFDLVGNPRVYGGRIDMGAYENQNVVVSTDEDLIPLITKLNQNYPNPFNPSTNINYSLKENSKVSLNIYNIKGQKVKQLVSSQLSAGQHSVIWNGKDENNKTVSSGIYFYKLKAGDYEKTKRMVLLK